MSAGIGEVHLRSRQYLKLIAFAALLGVVAAIAALSFLWAEHGLQALLWHRVPDALGVDPHPWFALAVTTLGGAAVGLVVRFVPGHGGTLGIAAHQAFTSIPLAVAVACGMAGATMVILRLPVFVILFIAFFGGPLLVPLIVVAAVTAYALVFDKPDLEGNLPDMPAPVPADTQPALPGKQ